MADPYYALIQKYFPREQWENARRVMQAESHGDARAHNTNGEDSRGLFQINVGPGANTGLAKYNLFDPETNVRLAAQKWQGEGWRPWTTAVQMGIASGGNAGGGGMATPDPNGVAREYTTQGIDPSDPSGQAQVTIFRRVYNDGRVEQWVWKGQGGYQGGVLGIGGEYKGEGDWEYQGFGKNDTEQEKRWQAQQKQYEAEQKRNEPDLRQGPDGIWYRIDPTTGKATPVEGMPGKATTQQPTLREVNGKLYQIDPATGKATPVEGIPGETEKPQFTSHGGQLYRVNPDGTLTVAIPRTPEEQQAARLAIEKEQLQIAKYRQGMVPPAQLLLQQQFESINQLQGMLERNEITPAEAETYMGQIKAQTQAALAGTTIFQQQQAEREYEQARRSTGANLLNTRLTTGAGMAQSILTGALGAYGKLYPGTGAPPMMDPLAMAQAFTTQMGGGQEVSDFAKSMLLGAGGGPGAPGAGQFPSTREAVLAMYPELAGGQPAAAPVAPIGPAAPAPAMPAPGPVPPAPIPSPPYPLPAARGIPRVA